MALKKKHIMEDATDEYAMDEQLDELDHTVMTHEEKDRERDYAVKKAKRERVESLIATAVTEASPSSAAEAIKVAEAEAKKALDEDMTGTLKPFSKTELESIAKAAYKKLKSEL